jgi:hypothetical protein
VTSRLKKNPSKLYAQLYCFTRTSNIFIKPLKIQQISEATTPKIDKFSSECVHTYQTFEELLSTVKWSEIVAGRNVKQYNIKNLSAQEISTILNGIISSEVIGKMISTQAATGTCKMSVN